METVLERLANDEKCELAGSSVKIRRARANRWGGRLVGLRSRGLEVLHMPSLCLLLIGWFTQLRWLRPLKGGSAVLRCGRRVMLTPRFMVKYHCRPSQRFLRRLGGGYEVTVPTKMIGIMVEGFK